MQKTGILGTSVQVDFVPTEHVFRNWGSKDIPSKFTRSFLSINS